MSNYSRAGNAVAADGAAPGVAVFTDLAETLTRLLHVEGKKPEDISLIIGIDLDKLLCEGVSSQPMFCATCRSPLSPSASTVATMHGAQWRGIIVTVNPDWGWHYSLLS